MVPWFQLHARNIESVRREGTRATIGLEGNATIEVDWTAKTYSASLNGIPAMGMESTFCPLGNDRIAFYSTSAKELSTQLPAGWEAGQIRAAKMTVNGPQEVQVTTGEGKIRVAVEARQPVILYRNDEAKRRRGETQV